MTTTDGTDLGADTRRLPDIKSPDAYPAAADLTQSCSLVMKGGITSGVIYPRAVCQIATTRRLARIGGTSAGAIAAAAAAAAEYARSTGTDASTAVGYPRLARLPDELVKATDGHTMLYQLFQPQRRTRAVYRVVSVWIGRGGKSSKLIRSVVPLLGALLPAPGLIAAIAAIALLGGALSMSNWLAVVLAAALVVVILVAMTAISLWKRINQDLPGNHFGLCTGMGSPTALTEWLTAEINQIAGKSPDGDPLTFGDLHHAGVELAMLTTDLSSGTQNELPFRSRVWAFDPVEFAEFFPPHIVRWLRKHPPEPEGDVDSTTFSRFEEHTPPLCPLPPPDQMPVIVGVRMSLSFPPLLSTVPLHAIDYTRTATGAPTISDPDTAPPTEHPIIRHRFSDGGITSNFPLTFFDESLPKRPTFGINLVEISDADLSPTQSDNVWMPTGNGQGILTRPTIIDSTTAFVGAILDTMQNWTDSMQAHVPGYRGRIVAVEHTKHEGGLNLDMDEPTIMRLAKRGQCAGQRTETFDFTNHRWVRFRSLLQTMQEFLAPAQSQLAADPDDLQPTYTQMINDIPSNPSSYRNPWNDDTRAAFTDVKAALSALADKYQSVDQESPADHPLIIEGAPKPHPRLQVRPRPLS
ncbi:MAG TPA: patatin-like phospholipase family protein [Mycobacterium sp.]|jgi:hypothetical protein|nr:patatin-like phospholipase family protein [Mycobacterium sp.]